MLLLIVFSFVNNTGGEKVGSEIGNPLFFHDQKASHGSVEKNISYPSLEHEYCEQEKCDPYNQLRKVSDNYYGIKSKSASAEFIIDEFHCSPYLRHRNNIKSHLSGKLHKYSRIRVFPQLQHFLVSLLKTYKQRTNTFFLNLGYAGCIPDGFINHNGEVNNPCKDIRLNNTSASHVDDPEVIFLRKRLFDDLTRTRTLDCDDQDVGSDISSYDSDSVALSVIVDQDLGLVGGTVPPNFSPPPIPGLNDEDIICSASKEFLINKLNTWPSATILEGNQIYLQIIKNI